MEVDYTLEPIRGQGELALGFNSVDIGLFHMINATMFVVEEGSGSHQFSASVVVKDWGAEGDFQAYVYLSEFPHGNPWTPLATDTEVLTFAK